MAVPAEVAVAVTSVVAIQVEVAEVAAKNPKIQKSLVYQTFSSEALGRALARTKAARGHKATGPHDHRATGLSCENLKVHALRTPKRFRARPWGKR